MTIAILSFGFCCAVLGVFTTILGVILTQRCSRCGYSGND